MTEFESQSPSLEELNCMAVCPPCCKPSLVLSQACTAAVQIDGNVDPVDTGQAETV